MTVKIKNTTSDIRRTDFESLYNLALEFKRNKDYINAIETYYKIIAQNQHNENYLECAKLYEDVGDIYYELKDFQHAFEFMQKALQIYADNKLYDLQLDQYRKIGSLQQGIWQFK